MVKVEGREGREGCHEGDSQRKETRTGNSSSSNMDEEEEVNSGPRTRLVVCLTSPEEPDTFFWASSSPLVDLGEGPSVFLFQRETIVSCSLQCEGAFSWMCEADPGMFVVGAVVV